MQNKNNEKTTQQISSEVQDTLLEDRETEEENKIKFTEDTTTDTEGGEETQSSSSKAREDNLRINDENNLIEEIENNRVTEGNFLDLLMNSTGEGESLFIS